MLKIKYIPEIDYLLNEYKNELTLEKRNITTIRVQTKNEGIKDIRIVKKGTVN
jgi:hypothetical protein